MNQQRPSRAYRIRRYAHQKPGRYGIIVGVLSGVFFGCVTTFFLMVIVLANEASVSWALLTGAASGCCFGIGMGVFTWWVIPEKLLPETDRAQMREAGRLVRKGVPGTDPETNQIAWYQAKATLNAPYWPKTQSTIFTLALVLNAWVLFRHHTDSMISVHEWINLAGIVFFALLLFVLMPFVAHQRRRARALLAAMEEGPNP
ncbi:hypothetical protein [Nocardiopsis halotolerans]|uniref:hypothetical protein n=1 Tax=Nocardiopsis halotolerans TaxID=124252 RepID=UPI000347388C|nr:hypothetical protein [Nocardiopsis halotolerans]